MSKVSVIIPTHNRAAFLEAAVRSVLRQTYEDFEVFIVDDASRDQTPEVVRGFSDRRIHFLRHETNQGQGRSRNAGIEMATGEYIAFLDDDDEWMVRKLEKQMQLFAGSPARVGLVYTGFYKIDTARKRRIGEMVPEKRGHIFKDMCMRNWIGTCSTVVVRRSALERSGNFDEGLASGADYDLWLRLSKEVDVEYLAEPLVLYNVHDNSISTSPATRIRGIEAQLSKHATWFAHDSRNYSRRYFFLGVLYCYQGDLHRGRRAIRKAIRLYPYEIRHYYNLFLSLLGSANFRRFKKLGEQYFHPL